MLLRRRQRTARPPMVETPAVETEVPARRTTALNSIAKNRALQAGAFMFALVMVATSCTGFDVKPAVSVKEVPIDLAFGGEKKLEEKPPVLQVPRRTIRFVDFPPPPPPPPLVLPPLEENPPRECGKITSVTVREPAVDEITDEQRPELGRYLFNFGGTPAGASKVERTGMKTLDQITIANAFVPDATNPGRTRTGFSYFVNDEFLGSIFRFTAFGGSNPSGLDPNIGLFVDRFGWPKTLGGSPAMDDETSQIIAAAAGGGSDGLIQPVPAVKILNFPVIEGQVTRSIGYDPLNRVFVTSVSRVVKKDNRVRTCDEWASAYEVEWRLSVGTMPDFEILLTPACDTDSLTQTFMDAVGTAPGSKEIAQVVIAFVGLLDRDEVPVAQTIRQALMNLIDQIVESEPDRDESEAVIEKNVRAQVSRLCNADDAQPLFGAVNGISLVHRQLGTTWFATQWGGFPIKEDITLEGTLLQGKFSSNIQELQPVGN